MTYINEEQYHHVELNFLIGIINQLRHCIN